MRLAKKLPWILLLVVLFALLVLYAIYSGFDQALFIDIVYFGVLGASIITLICCLCECCERLDG